ncbi:MAG TPA: type IV pilus biogenesis/stability protein PilW [Gammaproteobacteria bacterium]|nr:type IV pilus biogenesis/stability protein PilW [Gammaproteobacteria bacterium]
MNQPMRILIAIVALGLGAGCVTTSSADNQAAQDAALANLNLGVAYMRQGRPEIALANLQEALEYDPRLVAAHSTIAMVYEQLEQPDLAEQHYRRATQLAPEDGSAANSYAVFLCRTERWNEAERYFRRAADSPRYATPEAALTNAGVCARGVGDLSAAETYFREALARNSNFRDALFNMADLSFQSQDYLAARAFTQRYLSGAAGSAEILLLCVQVERQLGAADAAAQCAAQLRSGFPNSAEATQLNALERNER